MYVSMLNVLNIIKLHDDSGPFLTPVEEDCAPGYFDVIKEPMDISTMEYKVHRKDYKNKKQFEKDFKKMVKNCKIFNGDGNVYTNMAYSIWRVFTNSMKLHFPKNTKLEKETSPKLPLTLSEDLESSSTQAKLYVCSSKNVDGAIKITIKQTDTRIVPPTTLQSVKNNENGKPRFEIKKAASNFFVENNQNEITYSSDTPKFELPSRKIVPPPNKANVNNRPARGRKRKKKPIGMKAIEALAQAAEQALKDAASRSSFDDGIFSSHSNSPIYNSNAFPDLKISTTQSHPADLLNRLFRKANSDSSCCNSDKDSSIEKQYQVKAKSKGPSWVNGIIGDSPMTIKPINDLSNIFPCAAATLVFPRNTNSPSNIIPPLKSIHETYHLSQPCLQKVHSRTKFSDDSEDSSAFESDCSLEDFESRNKPPSTLGKSFPQIKPCQVTLSRLSPQLYYKGNKVRILEQVEKEKKRKKRLRSRSQLQSMAKRELRSTSVLHQEPPIKNNRDKEDLELERSIQAQSCSSLSPPPIHNFVPLPEPKTTNVEIRNETNFQQCWGKNNVPPRKRYSSLVPTVAERKMFFEKKNDTENVNASNILVSEQQDDSFHPLNLTFGMPKIKGNISDEDKYTTKNERDNPIVEEVKEECSTPAPLNTFQFEYITDSSSDEGYTTNERLSPILNSKNSWYYNSFASRIIQGNSEAGSYHKSSNEPHFGTTPFGNSALPNEKNGFSFEAQCPKDENLFYPIKTSSFIDFNMLTPLNLEIHTPNHCQNTKSLAVENSSSFNYDFTRRKSSGSMFSDERQPNIGVPPFISSFTQLSSQW